ncbi:hypothetical protein AB82_2043 [Escherichia coli 2-005-03_S3_C1]|nr:hypothetical protein EC2871950_3255 [Escherichia coli 2871950]EMW94705.1 hypothetical protein ECTHROOPD_3724 [Escherichia coli ThroopD]KDW58239.1 hypothetical protein AB82_2043 [Escherichia coli 2-005-03_S3_C1]KDW66536.1 hypothetical protein AC40_2201 [Escherichia coli 2-005-03_S3_C3]
MCNNLSVSEWLLVSRYPLGMLTHNMTKQPTTKKKEWFL